MSTKSFPAYFMRGGTSNGLLIKRSDLPADEEKWQPILASAMGSPDSFGRQLDGMGSGVSSTSKVMIVSKSDRGDADVDYTFVQVGIKDGSMDIAANCGNMSSAIGPFAVDIGLVPIAQKHTGRRANVRMYNTNTSKLLVGEFDVNKEGKYEPLGDYAIGGVPGTASHIALSFLYPAGAKTGSSLPTGHPIDELKLPDGSTIRASLVDIANPGVFILASDIGIPGNIAPDILGGNADLMARLEMIRQTGARRMGLDPSTPSIPKLVLLSSPTPAEATEQGINIICRALSMQQAHKAVPLTFALNIGASCGIPGTLANLTAVNAKGKDSIVIGHASGRLEAGSVVRDGEMLSALLHRTARVLMKGEVFYTIDDEE
ncbi:hypothetical protein LTR62_002739 [Meristemomyces frigidus]|uniref:PrpF protein n=1 Tax=Meristemomyces frigidus TaxID=1508187 RepID=A0AAN7TKF7_9PEZI|nr:hypothetical protein LTR62_002739 [Meristemomyces frigidus]